MRRRKFIVAMISVLALLLVFTIGLVACNPNGGEPQSVDEAYYLSLKSTGWETYATAQEIPAGVLLTKSGEGEYKLSIALDADDEFTVNKLGSNDKLGFGEVLSTSNHLAEGESGNIKVVHSGAYALTVSGGFVSYNFTALVEGVQIVAPAAKLDLGEEYPFAATVQMSDDSVSDKVAWSSSNAQVASVSESGLVKALAVGSAVIKATSIENSQKFAEYSVEVVQGKIDVQSVTLTPAEVTLSEGDTTTLTAQISPDNATDQLVLWSSDKESVATVDGGTVTAIAPGIAHITVRTRDGGKEATATITVRQPATSIYADAELKVVAGGLEREVSVTVSPSDATIKDFEVQALSGSTNVTFRKDNDGRLLVKGVQEGSARLKITSADNAQLTAEVSVTVLAEGSPLVGIQKRAQILINEDAHFALEMENVTASNVAWAIDNSNIAKLTANGNEATVTGLDLGSARLTATVSAQGGERYTAEADILVSDDWYFIYGVGIGNKDWDWETYLTDKNLAKKDEVLLDATNERGKYSLTRLLTPEQTFQIIFPNVASYTDAAGDWTKGIKDPATQYDAANSSDSYVENTKDQFKVKAAGIYTITLDLSGGRLKVAIKLVSLSLTDIMLSMRQTESNVLRDGIETYVDFVAVPSDAQYNANDIKWEVTTKAANAVLGNGKITIGSATIEYYTSRTNHGILTLSMSGDVTENTSLTVKAIYGDSEATLDVPVLMKNAEVTPVTSIQFEQAHYYINVNNGGNVWETNVKAAVNSNATVTGVTYSTDDEQLTIDAMSGRVKANAFGTFEVKATSVADKSKVATALVTVYSDSFYLVGKINNKLTWDGAEPFAPAITSLEGSVFEDYAFSVSEDKTQFEYRGILSANDVFQIVFLGMDANWTNVITAANYDRSASDTVNSWEYETYNVQVKLTGIYSIKLDLTGKTPKFNVNYAEPAASSLSLDLMEGEKEMVKNGESFKLFVNYTPNYLIRQDEDFKWSVDEGYEDYLDIDYQWRTFTAVITVKKAVAEVKTFAVYLELDVSKASYVVTLLPDDFEEVKPTSVTFEKEHYYFNVNNGGAAWTQTVKASVNAEASIKGVKYSISTSGCTVDPVTGEVTAQRLGTFRIYATAIGDDEVRSYCQVTFYSDSFYLIGEIGDLQTFDVLPPTASAVTGIYASYKFEQIDETHFRLERELREMQKKAGNYGDYEYGFQIAYLGCESTGGNVIKTSNLNNQGCYNSSTYISAREGNMRVKVTGVYIIDLDLSGSSASWTINYKDLPEQNVQLTASENSMKKDGSIQVKVAVNPSWIALEQSNFSFIAAEGFEQYVSFEFNMEDMTLTVTAKDSDLKEDKTFAITVKYGTKSSDLNITVVAQHHLELTSDDTQHWYRCTDPGCDYTEGEEGHKMSTTLKHDGKQHYLACEVCGGGKQSIEDHFALTADGWYDGSVNSCEECGFKVFEIDEGTGTLTKYNGEFEKVRVPAEIDGVTITKIGEKAFRYNTFLKEVEVADEIKDFGGYVFEGCTSLTSYKMTDLPTTLGYYTFKGCTSLEIARVPLKYEYFNNTATYWIGSTGMYNDCTSLKTATFAVDAAPGQVYAIANSCFVGCSQLTGVTLPANLKEIGKYAFQDCVSLGELHFPKQDIGLDFNIGACSHIGATKLYFDPDTPINIGDSVFNGWLGDSIELPKRTSSNIGVAAFANCVNLKSIVIPDSVNGISRSTFENCTSLETVEFGTGFAYFSAKAEDTFTNCTSLRTVLFRGKMRYFADRTFNNCNNLEAVFIGSTKAEIDAHINSGQTFVSSDIFTLTLADRLLTDLRGNKHMYAYSATQPAAGTDYGIYFGGYWHYDSEGNPVVWDEKPATAAQILDLVPVTLYAEDKKR